METIVNHIRTTIGKTMLAVAILAFAMTAECGCANAWDTNSGTDSQRQACTGDAMRYCLGSPGGVDGIVVCLKRDPRVSKACKAVVNGPNHTR
jgi:hypothetical protein